MREFDFYSDELIRALKQLRKCKLEFKNPQNEWSKFSFIIKLAGIVVPTEKMFNFDLLWQTPILARGPTMSYIYKIAAFMLKFFY